MWEAYRKHFGKDGDSVLVWQADTHTMNPELDSEIIDQAYDEDSAAAGAEYGAQFRSDVDGFIPPEVVEAAVVKGRFELEPVSDLRYFGFIDPSGGSADSMTMAIAHIRDSKGVLDLVREKKPPFSPENVSKEFADELKRFRITQAQSDYYAGEWPREQFSKHGISVKTSERSRSEIYLEILPALNSGKLELLDNPRLVSQLCSLERRTARSGKDSVDHPPGGHDDVINAAAGALVQCVSITKTTSIIDAYRHMNAARQEAQQQHASA